MQFLHDTGQIGFVYEVLLILCAQNETTGI